MGKSLAPIVQAGDDEAKFHISNCVVFIRISDEYNYFFSTISSSSSSSWIVKHALEKLWRKKQTREESRHDLSEFFSLSLLLAR